MLKLSRRGGESIQIGEDIEITVLWIRPQVVRIGIKAPGQMRVLRTELRASSAPSPTPTRAR